MPEFHHGPLQDRAAQAAWQWRSGWLLVGALLAVLWLPSASHAQEAGELPWYDSGSGEVLPMDLQQRNDARSRDRDQVPVANSGTGTGNRNTGRFGNGIGEFGSLLSFLVWGFFGLLLVLIAGGLIYAFFRLETNRRPAEESQPRRSLEESMQELPFELDAAPGDFRALAQAAYQRGDLRRAMMLLFSHVLVLLDQRGLVRLRKGKTNRQYLRELRSNPGLVDYYQRVMIPFEETFFGDREVRSAVFEQCWAGLEPFQAQVKAAQVGGHDSAA